MAMAMQASDVQRGGPVEGNAALSAVPLWERVAGIYCVFHFSDALWGTIFSDPTAIDESPLLRLFWYPLYAMGLYGFIKIWRQGIKTFLSSPAMLAILGLVFMSVLWSVDPDVTIRRSFALFMTTLFGVYLAARYDWKSLVLIFASGFALMAVAGLLGPLLAPDLFIHKVEYPGAWKGVWRHKNQVGALMSLSVAVCLCAGSLMPGRIWMWRGFAALSFFLIIMAQSVTAILATGLGVSVFVLLSLFRKGPAPAFAFGYMALMLLLAALAAFLFAPDDVYALLGRNSTLTGRAGIWQLVQMEIATRPWLGHGYAAFWHDARGPALYIRETLWFPVPHSHNSWLELSLDIGYIGAALVGWYLAVTTVRGGRKITDPVIAPFVLPIMTMIFMYTLSETALLQANNFNWVLLTAIGVKLASEAQDRRTAPRAIPVRLSRRRPAAG